MKVIKRGQMPDGTDIQIEDWSREYPGVFQGAATLAAYPAAKLTLPGKFSPTLGETFRVQFDFWTGRDADAAFTALESGVATLEDYTPSSDDYTEPPASERPRLWDPARTRPTLTGRM